MTQPAAEAQLETAPTTGGAIRAGCLAQMYKVELTVGAVSNRTDDTIPREAQLETAPTTREAIRTGCLAQMYKVELTAPMTQPPARRS